MITLCNGLPKSGTHALEKAVQLLGRVTELDHVPYSDKREGRQLLIKRHPRNVVISWLRESFAGLPTVVWAVSYWPWIAALVVGLPIVLMPMLFDLSSWVYLFSLPLGITAGVLGYLGAYMMLED